MTESRARIDVPRDQIAELCRRHRIRWLAFFGSVLRDDFRPRATWMCSSSSSLTSGTHTSRLHRSRASSHPGRKAICTYRSRSIHSSATRCSARPRRSMSEHDDRLPMIQMLEHAKRQWRSSPAAHRSELSTRPGASTGARHLVQIVGEAAGRVSRTGQAKYPDVPWAQAITTRQSHRPRLRPDQLRRRLGHHRRRLSGSWLRPWSGPGRRVELMPGTIDQLIVNKPYEEPTQHWKYDRESRTFSREPGRRSAGYVVATSGSKAFDDPGVFVPLPLVNRIRPRVKAWREAGHPGVTGTTRRLLDHWRDPELWQERRFFFCQLEAVETLIWLTEAPAGERQGIDVPGDGGPFTRLCAKMATGSGKTLVMAMVIAWHILNRVANPQDGRFSKHVLVVAPGLTVRKRLAVLDPADAGQLLRHVRHGALRPARAPAPGARADPQLAHAQLGKRGADRPAARRRQARGDERRRVRQGGAGRDGLGLEPPRRQRRGASRLARARGIEGARRREGRHRGGHALDRRAGPHPPEPRHPRLL